MRRPLPLGARGELAARRLLRRQGHRILHANYRHKLGELDIVSDYRGTIVFTEVKTRARDADFYPADNLSSSQISNLRRVAEIYLRHYALTSRDVRFDVVEVTFPSAGRGHPRIEQFKQAF